MRHLAVMSFMLLLTIFSLLAGCTPPAVEGMTDTRNEEIDTAYIVLSPLCAVFCTTQVTTSGVVTDVRGSDNTGGATSVSQSASATTSAAK